jgi:hypothetical protein
MTMQTDVLAGTLVESGFIYKQRTRVKGVSIKGDGTNAGLLQIFDTVTTPVTATYARTGDVVTVTKNAHGLSTGDTVGLSFAPGTGGSASDGNYRITKLTDNTFTITDLNSGSITAGANCVYAPRWIMTFRIDAGDAYVNYWLLPGQGIVAQNGVYLLITNLNAASIFYG